MKPITTADIQRLFPALPPADREIFAEMCNRMELDPYAGQIMAEMRGGYDNKPAKMMTVITIDGHRAISHRSYVFGGIIGPHFTADGKTWVDLWMDSTKLPLAARVGIIRTDCEQPIYATVLMDKYFNQKSQAWKRDAPHMLGKCAESAAHAKAIPYTPMPLQPPAKVEPAQAAPKPCTKPSVTEVAESIAPAIKPQPEAINHAKARESAIAHACKVWNQPREWVQEKLYPGKNINAMPDDDVYAFVKRIAANLINKKRVVPDDLLEYIGQFEEAQKGTPCPQS